MDILEEQVEIVRGLLGPSRFSYSGAHYTYSGVQALPKPVRGHLPLLLGGNAGPRAARLAARWPDRDSGEVIAELRESGRYVVGALDAAAEQLQAFAAAGADRLILALTDHRDLDHVFLIGHELSPMLT
jgi:alkanesulfonate monooxygenase SsuD/methylene tetrahydromethanopterin reductase-like flavin-dependent oxidoreductase (luciferase family)